MATGTPFAFGDGERSTEDGIGDVASVLGAVQLGGDGNSTGDDRDGGNDREFDPERHISRSHVNADGSFRRKRRRRGSGSAAPRSSANNNVSVDALTQMLIVVHAGLASVTKIKELELDTVEGKTLATAVANVAVEFDIPIDRKTQALVGLIVAGASIYGPRLYLYNERMKDVRKARKHGPTVVAMTGFGDQPNSSMYDAPLTTQ